MQTILISRSDAIGDVVLTLPLCGAIKEKYPHIKIAFLGKEYTRSVIEHSEHVDYFLDYDALAMMPTDQAIENIEHFDFTEVMHVFPQSNIAKWCKKAGIPDRIGTSHRWYHWLYCNRLLHFSRKKSDLHEAQLNFHLAKKLNIDIPKLAQIPDWYGLGRNLILPKHYQSMLENHKFKLIIHPRSHGSARDWQASYWCELIHSLPLDQVQVFVTGSSKDQEWISENLAPVLDKVENLSGKMDLRMLMTFIQKCDGLVACSTGPLHLAAAMGKRVLGIYPSIAPIYPTRWAPVGIAAEYIVSKSLCTSCTLPACQCMLDITPHQVATRLSNWWH